MMTIGGRVDHHDMQAAELKTVEPEEIAIFSEPN